MYQSSLETIANIPRDALAVSGLYPTLTGLGLSTGFDDTPTDDWDYIVVGSGAAGGVITKRLNEKYPLAKILLLERGGPRERDTKLEARVGQGILNQEFTETLIDVKSGMPITTARVLGGGTSINGGLYLEDEPAEWLAEAQRYVLESTGKTFTLDPVKIEAAYAWLRATGLFCPNNDGFWSRVKRPANAQVGYTPIIEHHLFRLPPRGTFKTYVTFCGPERRRTGVTQLIHELPNVRVRMHTKVKRVVLQSEGQDDLLRAGVPWKDESFVRCVEAEGYLKPTSGLVGAASEVVSNTVSSLRGVVTGVLGRDITGANQRYCVKPGGRVIVSAGAVHTPALLMRSGVGNRARTGGQDVVIPVEHLGGHFVDHASVGMMVFNHTMRDYPVEGDALTTQQSYGVMPIGGPACAAAGGELAPGAEGPCQLVTMEESSGGDMPFEFMVALLTKFLNNKQYEATPGLGLNTLGRPIVELVRDCVINDVCIPVLLPLVSCMRKSMLSGMFIGWPTSRGEVSISATGEPLVDAQHLTSQEDRAITKEAMRRLLTSFDTNEVRAVTQKQGGSCGDLLATIAYNNLLGQLTGLPQEINQLPLPTNLGIPSMPVKDPLDVPAIFPYLGKAPDGKLGRFGENEELLERILDTHSISIFHYSATAALGAVVDPASKFQIRADSGLTIEGLTVCDASVLPTPSRSNTMAATMMMGHLCADTI